MNYIYDTNILLSHLEMIDLNEKVYIPAKVLEEIEDIKCNRNKTEQIQYEARVAARWLRQHMNEYEIIRSDTDYDKPDYEIIHCATMVGGKFVTGDINCANLASSYGLEVIMPEEKCTDNYTGFKEIKLNDVDMAYLYEHLYENKYDLLINEYLIIKNKNGEIVDKLCWDGEKLQNVFNKNIKTVFFDKLKAKDIYQQCAIDSLVSNSITAISGKAGSGKSLLSLMVAMWLIETGKYDRIVILFNPTKARGACDLGFYGGDFLEKAMQNSIGQILTTKFGDRYAVDLLMSQNKIKLVSMADCRGMEITDNEILWITEAQNTSVDLIKLCLSRVSSGAKVFIEGDYTSQVDSYSFEGRNNGLKRMIDVFKGHQEFGYVQLQNVWRSKIAELCELL